VRLKAAKQVGEGERYDSRGGCDPSFLEQPFEGLDQSIQINTKWEHRCNIMEAMKVKGKGVGGRGQGRVQCTQCNHVAG
jgi:hypothetical protein